MKTLLLSILSLACAVGSAVGARDQDQSKTPKNKSHVAPAPRVNAAPRTISQPRVQHNVRATRFQPTVTNRADTQNHVQPRIRDRATFAPSNRNALRPTRTVNTDTAAADNWRARTRDRSNSNVVTPQSPRSSTTTVQSNTNVRNRDWQNRTNANRNWQNNNTAANFTFDQARNRHNREHHDRGWWRSHYNRIVLFGGGYYYWDGGYWYPAYGYDPYYSTYAYEGPIYGYNHLAPGQVIANVQAALQQQGYYDDAVDGLIVPRTRAALSNFQRDHELPITAAIDGPTLQALGLY
jgi:hypothetical protein